MTSDSLIHQVELCDPALLISPFTLPKSFDFDPIYRRQFLDVESFDRDLVLYPPFAMAAPNDSQNDLTLLGDETFAVSPAPMMQSSPQTKPTDNAPQEASQFPQQAQAQPMIPDPNFYSIDYAIHPWQTAPSNGNDARARVIWHLTRLNLMHEARKEKNDKYSFVYQQQSNLLSSATVACISTILGFHNLNLLLAIYHKDPTKNAVVLPRIYAAIRDNITPALFGWGPVRVREVINRFMDAIDDPQTRVGWYNNTAAELYQTFCGIKGALLTIDRWREKNPEACADDEMAGLTFSSQFTVTRQQFWLWLTPNRNDEGMGDYDHWFET